MSASDIIVYQREAHQWFLIFLARLWNTPSHEQYTRMVLGSGSAHAEWLKKSDTTSRKNIKASSKAI
jgi:hypothetical protein